MADAIWAYCIDFISVLYLQSLQKEDQGRLFGQFNLPFLP